MPPPKDSLQTLCDELMKMGDILACYAVNQEGRLLGANYGQVPVDDQLKEEFSQIASAIWGGLQRVASIGGPLRMVSAIFDNFKIIGLPIEGTNVALMLTVEVKLDSYVIKDRVLDFMKYWLKVNNYIE